MGVWISEPDLVKALETLGHFDRSHGDNEPMVIRLIERLGMFGIRIVFEDGECWGEHKYLTCEQRVWLLYEVRDTSTRQFNNSQTEVLAYLALNTTQYSSPEEYFHLVS